MYFQPSDELSAIAAVEAKASQGGRYVDSTSSQGLVLKTKNLFSVTGKRLPVVMSVMAREVNKGSLSFHCVYGVFQPVFKQSPGLFVVTDGIGLCGYQMYEYFRPLIHNSKGCLKLLFSLGGGYAVGCPDARAPPRFNINLHSMRISYIYQT